MNRYEVIRNTTPSELVHKTPYGGYIAQVAEPVYGFFKFGAK